MTLKTGWSSSKENGGPSPEAALVGQGPPQSRAGLAERTQSHRQFYILRDCADCGGLTLSQPLSAVLEVRTYRDRGDPMSKKNVPVASRAKPSAGFGAPVLLEGEDGAHYDKLLTQVTAAVAPTDVIEEFWV